MGKPVIDLTGQTFGLWTVLERDYQNAKNGKAYWKCRCECGTERSVVGSDLRNHKSTGCGCNRVAHNFVDLTGQTFNYLTVKERLENRYNGKAYWKCECICGNIVEVSTEDLKNNHTISCGCKKIERFTEVGKNSFKDLTGMRFGLLTVLSKTEKRTGTSVVWLCQCDCGKQCEIAGGDLNRSLGTKSCGCLGMSKGELLISQILNELNIEYEQEKTFNDCKSPFTGYLLRYDFYLPQYNLLIEYDGEQHFQEVNYFKDSLEEVQIKDNYKNNYAKENNYYILRIPYNDYEILTKEYLIEKIQEVTNNYVCTRIRPKYQVDRI